MTQTSQRTISERLEQEILARARSDGGRLPPERVLAREFGVSRGTLRRAMENFVRQGLVHRHVGRGTFVRPTATADAAMATPPDTSPAEMMETRLLIEPALAGLAALRARTEDIARIRDAAERCTGATAADQFEQADAAFHLAVVRAARNNLMLELLQRIDAARRSDLWGRAKARSATPERRTLYARQHAAVLAAIASRDAEAARRQMRAHLLTVRRHLLGSGLALG